MIKETKALLESCENQQFQQILEQLQNHPENNIFLYKEVAKDIISCLHIMKLKYHDYDNFILVNSKLSACDLMRAELFIKKYRKQS